MAFKLLQLTVSIINYRTATLTLDCVRSVLAELRDIRGQVVVIDNDSGDDSVLVLQQALQAELASGRVQLLRSSCNSGFAGGHNQVIAAFPADHYLILNSDTLLHPGSLSALLAATEQYPDYGFIAPEIDDGAGRVRNSVFRFPGPYSELSRAAQTGFVSRRLARYQVAIAGNRDVDAIEWVSFSAVLVSHRLVDDVGPMDEGYFLYFEDVDYCWRAAQKQWRSYYVPAARVTHFSGKSGPVKKLLSSRARLPRYYYASRARFLARAYGRRGLLAANLLWHLGRGIARLRALSGRSVPPANVAEARDIWIRFWHPMVPDHASAQAMHHPKDID